MCNDKKRILTIRACSIITELLFLSVCVSASLSHNHTQSDPLHTPFSPPLSPSYTLVQTFVDTFTTDISIPFIPLYSLHESSVPIPHTRKHADADASRLNHSKNQACLSCPVPRCTHKLTLSPCFGLSGSLCSYLSLLPPLSLPPTSSPLLSLPFFHSLPVPLLLLLSLPPSRRFPPSLHQPSVSLQLLLLFLPCCLFPSLHCAHPLSPSRADVQRRTYDRGYRSPVARVQQHVVR